MAKRLQPVARLGKSLLLLMKGQAKVLVARKCFVIMDRRLFGVLAGVEVLVFGLLEGSMVTLGLVVAPALFKTVESRDLAGRAFGNILGVWFWVGLVCTLLLVVTGAVALIKVKPLNRWLLARLVVLLPMTGLIIGFGLVLSRINTIQASLTKPIEQYATDVNPRLEFDQLHKLSTNLLSFDLVLGLVWLLISIVALVRSGNKPTLAPIEHPERIPAAV